MIVVLDPIASGIMGAVHGDASTGRIWFGMCYPVWVLQWLLLSFGRTRGTCKIIYADKN